MIKRGREREKTRGEGDKRPSKRGDSAVTQVPEIEDGSGSNQGL